MPSSLLNNTTFQGRLGRVMDRIQRRCNDNVTRLQGSPIDVIRISAKRDPQSQDIITRKFEGAEVMPIIFPQMKDVPVRHFLINSEEIKGSGELEAGMISVPSLYPINDKAYYEIFAPVACQINDEDLLLRLIWDAGDERPYVMCLQVKEVLATVSKSGNITDQKIRCTFYDEELPSAVINTLLLEYKKRMTNNF